jgi:hypothetical protein
VLVDLDLIAAAESALPDTPSSGRPAPAP